MENISFSGNYSFKNHQLFFEIAKDRDHNLARILGVSSALGNELTLQNMWIYIPPAYQSFQSSISPLGNQVYNQNGWSMNLS